MSLGNEKPSLAKAVLMAFSTSASGIRPLVKARSS